MPIQLLSHRGYWKSSAEKNTAEAFDRSFSMGFGTETDFRDRNGTLVISHDPAKDDAMTAESFFAAYQSFGQPLPLALNIKADGLQTLLKKLIDNFKVMNYFVFDMSVPDTLHYIKNEFRVFTRQSEYEPVPSSYNQAAGVWVDGFLGSDWINTELLEGHILAGKQVCIVSPELHGREHLGFWGRLKSMPVSQSSNVMLCTDFPEEARIFFND